MKRTIIKIDEELCTGCGLCVEACHEGAVGMREGKAVLLRDDYCDGLGDCLPACPAGAIAFEEREAAAYDEVAVQKNLAQKQAPVSAGCPGLRAQALQKQVREGDDKEVGGKESSVPSQLSQWPVQIKLAPVRAGYFEGADLLVAADCAAYAYGNFHQDFMKDRVTLIGCPKLDAGDYSEKLAEILRANTIRSITIARMEVPCCGGLVSAVTRAVEACGKDIPLSVETISVTGERQ